MDSKKRPFNLRLEIDRSSLTQKKRKNVTNEGTPDIPIVIEIDQNQDTSKNNTLNVMAPEFIPLGKRMQGSTTISSGMVFMSKQKTELQTQTTTEQQNSNVTPTIPPWSFEIKEKNKSTLHNEILAFLTYITPTPYEIELRQSIVDKITNCVASTWKRASVEVFGSFSTNLFLPFSDLDLVVINAPTASELGRSPLDVLSNSLRNNNVANQLRCIKTAKVPIIKITDIDYGIACDISFNIENGIQNTKTILQYMKEFPNMRPLVLLLKYFLQQRGLNETFSGGLGSYAISLLVFIGGIKTDSQMYDVNFGNLNKSKSATEDDLGKLLIQFFELYGIKFNYYKTGISLTNRAYFSKESRGALNVNKPYLLSLEDPNDEDNDVGKGSFALLHVRDAFFHAFHVLNNKPTCSLSHIMNMEKVWQMHNYREYCQQKYKTNVQ